ncbi:MAG: MBOAT family O-acyltransferase [Erysipelotrichaceae bacterium]
MEFSTLFYILLFMPLVVLLSMITKNMGIKNTILVSSSILFYAWGQLAFLWMYLAISVGTYCIAKYLKKTKYQTGLLILYVAFMVGILLYFKYFDFALSSLNAVLSTEFSLLQLALPLGISFFTFQSLGYMIDVYNQKIEAEDNLLKFMCFTSFFPSFISGPILRYEQIKEQLDYRNVSLEEVANGFRLFIMGLGKKVIIANNIAVLANYSFSSDLTILQWQFAWLGAIAYMLQIYFDFSGYSDMAIGVANMLGFKKIPANFNYPYMSVSISEFWRRWHISLGSWFKDYVYIPLGGNRVSISRWIFNMFTVWFLTGLWHGASIVFILWGLYYGIILMLEKFFIQRLINRLPKLIAHVYVLLVTLYGWTIFNSSSLYDLMQYTKAFIRSWMNLDYTYFMHADIVYLWPILIGGLLLSSNIGYKLYKKIEMKCGYITDFYLVLILVISVVLIVNNTFSPTIYFNF